MNSELKKRILTSIIISVVTFFFIIQGDVLFILFLVCTLCISIIEWINLSRSKLSKILGLVLLLISFLSAYILRSESISFFILIISISISSDIGGYIFGKIFGGRKLTKISPNKTYAGAFGSYVLSFFTTLFYLRMNSNFNKDLDYDSYIIYFFLIFLISTINQIGDLIISYFKRIKKVNDTGSLLPGHGGLLDRIDGMIFAMPLGYILYLIL